MATYELPDGKRVEVPTHPLNLCGELLFSPSSLLLGEGRRGKGLLGLGGGWGEGMGIVDLIYERLMLLSFFIFLHFIFIFISFLSFLPPPLPLQCDVPGK